MAGLLTDILSRIQGQKLSASDEAQLVKAIADSTTAQEGAPMAADDLAKVYEEHNGKEAHSDVRDQCQCAKCAEYRKGK